MTPRIGKCMLVEVTRVLLLYSYSVLGVTLAGETTLGCSRRVIIHGYSTLPYYGLEYSRASLSVRITWQEN